MQSLPHAGNSSGIASDIRDIREMMQTIQLVTAIQNARLLPWCDASSASSAPSTSDFKGPCGGMPTCISILFVVTDTACSMSSHVHSGLVQTYQLKVHHDADKRQYQKCQVTQELMLSGATVAAHLFLRRATVDLLYTSFVCQAIVMLLVSFGS